MDLGDEAAGARLWWFAPRLARGAARCDDSWTRALCVSLLFPLGFLGLAGVLRLIAMTVGVWEDWVEVEVERVGVVGGASGEGLSAATQREIPEMGRGLTVPPQIPAAL